MPSRGCRPALPTSTPSAPRQKNRSARQKHGGSACCKSKHSAPASSSIRRLEASALRVEIIAPFDDLWPIHDKHPHQFRSEEHTSELQSLMRISYAVFCLKKKTKTNIKQQPTENRQQTPNI